MGKRGELGMNFDLEYVNCGLCGKSATRIYATVSYMDYLNRRPELKSDADPILENEELANYKFSLASSFVFPYTLIGFGMSSSL
ncbi:unnamed protein product [marine sediment metagenome]|uniref:Uncharacterized protein n=1 Tax=marine sediment metagenome TaxID=412755 RepID=X1I722_9ZZZZ